MVAFHMFCHEDARLAREIARPPFEEYFRALNEAVGDWARGTTSKDYRDYDTSMRRLRSFTLDGQIEFGGAWVGTPDEIKAIIRRVLASIGKFEHASLQINFGALDVREAQKSMRLFAAEVMPEFAETRAARRPSRWRRRARPATTAAVTREPSHGQGVSVSARSGRMQAASQNIAKLARTYCKRNMADISACEPWRPGAMSPPPLQPVSPRLRAARSRSAMASRVGRHPLIAQADSGRLQGRSSLKQSTLGLRQQTLLILQDQHRYRQTSTAATRPRRSAAGEARFPNASPKE